MSHTTRPPGERQGRDPGPDSGPASAPGTEPAPDVAPSSAAPGVVSSGIVRGTRSWIVLAITAALLGGSTVALFLPLVPLALGGAACLMMLCLLFLRVPIAVAMLVPSLLGAYALRGLPLVESTLTTMAYRQVATWTLSVVPMFILMGLLLWRAGITESMFKAARHWIGWVPGGLGVGTNLAGTGLAAVSGSTLGTTYAITRIGIPEMLRAGYDKRLAISSVVAAGLAGQLIPPSLLLVIYAGIAEVPIGPQLLAGIGPGLLVGVAFSIAIVLLAALRPGLAGRGAAVDAVKATWGDRFSSLVRVWPVPVLIGVIVIGMFSGVFTATEAGAVAALFSLVVTFVWKRGDRPWRAVSEAAISTVSTVGAIFLLLVAAGALAQMLTLSGISTAFADFMEATDLGRVQFLLAMMVLYLVLGMFMDTLTMMVLTVPIMLPTLAALEISPLWFGVFVVFMGELGMLTPPVGILSFIIHGIVKDPEVNLGQRIDLKDVLVGVAWVMPVAILVTLVLIGFPDLVTYIPDRAAG